MQAGQFVVIAELAANQYNDVEHIKHHGHNLSKSDRVAMKEHACRMFLDAHGDNAWPINSSWSNGKKSLVSTMVIGKGYIPVEVPDSLYDMLDEEFGVDSSIEEMIDFRPIPFLEKFLEDHKRNMRAKPIKKLEKTLYTLKTLRGY